MTPEELLESFGPVPALAILRGLEPHEAVPVADALASAGWRVLEVPLNRPRALEAIAAIAAQRPDLLVGAGTVVEPTDVRRVVEAGGRFSVAPHLDSEVAAAAHEFGLPHLPGVLTPTEIRDAARARCPVVKIFPYQALGPSGLRAVAEVVAPGTALVTVGGMGPTTVAPAMASGARAVGVGSSVFQPGMTPEAVHLAAKAITKELTEKLDAEPGGR